MRLSRTIKLQLLRVLKIKDAPHKIAGGVACGMATHFYPLFGFGPLLSLLFAKATGTSILASLIGWGASSWSWPFLFYLNVKVGDLLLGHRASPRLHISSITHMHPSAWLVMGKSFLIGMMVNSLLAIILLTALGTWLMARYRVPLLHRVKSWQISR